MEEHREISRKTFFVAAAAVRFGTLLGRTGPQSSGSRWRGRLSTLGRGWCSEKLCRRGWSSARRFDGLGVRCGQVAFTVCCVCKAGFDGAFIVCCVCEAELGSDVEVHSRGIPFCRQRVWDGESVGTLGTRGNCVEEDPKVRCELHFDNLSSSTALGIIRKAAGGAVTKRMEGSLDQSKGSSPKPGKRNGLINTKDLKTDSKDGLVSLYSAPQYQGYVLGSFPSLNYMEQGRNGSDQQQVLNPRTLQHTVETQYRPNIFMHSESVLRAWGEIGSTDCCETTFIESRSPIKDGLDDGEDHLIDLSTADGKLQTLSYDVEDEDEFQELESDYSSDTESEDNFLLLPPKDHLGLSVFSMLCCFWPLGIAAFYLSHEEWLQHTERL
ncbi:uncharacterized protein [Hemitrygon akajei]|uniref:uncharacterized protein isoform X2 n=1 Tax=Hemitrygon akajei TaxID=2704970 RepID=UPI003BF9DC9A